MNAMGPRDALGVANRAIKNLEILKSDSDAHVVTAIVSTALALLLLPFDEWFREEADLVHLVAGSTPWQVDPRSETEISLLQHLRNAFAHGEVKFEAVESAPADSRNPAEVRIRFRDRPISGEYNWWASIRVDELEQYLHKLHAQLRRPGRLELKALVCRMPPGDLRPRGSIRLLTAC